MGNYIIIKDANFSQVAVEKVTIITDSDYNYVDFNSLSRVNFFNIEGTFNGSPSCYFVPIDAKYTKFGVQANNVKATLALFLKSIPTAAGQAADLCDMSQMQYWNNSSKNLVVPIGTTCVWTIPEDCNYIYIASQTITVGDYTPDSAWFGV